MAEKEGARAKPVGVAEYLFAELRYAVQDIRQKVVEQGWFGRVTTAKPVEIHNDIDAKPLERPEASPLAELRRPTFEELWGQRERGGEPLSKGHEHEVDR